VDDDRVERSNLHRQIAHADARVGVEKTRSGRLAIESLNPTVRVVEHHVRLAEENAEELIGAYDVIVDGSDRLATRYVVSDTCVRLKKPLVYAAVWQWEGQIAVFPAGGQPCYRCLFPEASATGAPSCVEAGVLGAVPGVMGTLQAVEALKLVLGVNGVPKLVCYDARTSSFDELTIAPDPDCPACG
jgi:molybdopterin/thiamine biosynthesis adenylyltransferase